MSCNSMYADLTMYSTGNNPFLFSTSVVDVNNDNKPDIIVASTDSSNIFVPLYN